MRLLSIYCLLAQVSSSTPQHDDVRACPREDARNAGIATSIGMNDVVGRGADGDVRGEFVSLDRVELGSKRAEGVEAVVLNSGEQSLLGQTVLSQFGSVEIQGDKMVLR